MTAIPAPAFDLRAIEPLLVIAGTALFVLVLDLVLPRRTRASLALATIVGMVIAMMASLLLSAEAPLRFMTESPSMVVLDTYAIFFNLLLLTGGILTILASVNYLEEMQSHHGEYYVLILCAMVGMMTMAAATDLITVFLGLEVMSIPVYILAGFNRRRVRSNEAALKYFLLGAFATGLFLYGIALIYGATGTTDLSGIRAAWHPTPLALAGLGFVLVGFGFKISSVPFHMWTPDVYEGAPTPVTGFMAVGVKAAAFAAFVRVFFVAFDVSADKLNALLWILAVATGTAPSEKNTSTGGTRLMARIKIGSPFCPDAGLEKVTWVILGAASRTAGQTTRHSINRATRVRPNRTHLQESTVSTLRIMIQPPIDVAQWYHTQPLTWKISA